MSAVRALTFVLLVLGGSVSAQSPQVAPSTQASITVPTPWVDLSNEPSEICWPLKHGDLPMVCVPMTILRATFAGYEAGQPSPLHVAQQQLISAQIQYAQELEAHRACEGALGPLQAKAHSDVLAKQQAALTAALEAAAPTGTTWDAKARRYVPSEGR